MCRPPTPQPPLITRPPVALRFPHTPAHSNRSRICLVVRRSPLLVPELLLNPLTAPLAGLALPEPMLEDVCRNIHGHLGHMELFLGSRALAYLEKIQVKEIQNDLTGDQPAADCWSISVVEKL